MFLAGVAFLGLAMPTAVFVVSDILLGTLAAIVAATVRATFGKLPERVVVMIGFPSKTARPCHHTKTAGSSMRLSSTAT